MLHPHTILQQVNAEIGLGVFATQFIPKGTITWIRDSLDQVLTPEQFRAMPQIYESKLSTYTFRDAKGHHILCWDAGRFINHSCEPNCMGYGIDFEIAIRDIYPGEELTNDYMSLNPFPDERFHCQCGSPECRHWICYNDVAINAGKWVRSMQQAFTAIEEVPQPLWCLLQPGTLRQAMRYLDMRATRILQVACS